ncbi:discoidin domain-containing protein [Chamaesiphon sp.]|uniref:discoidin domain-containing protein n=1 Tax=Chamaesiphon sp. TaxID=2814140 RepID=UPI003593E826
MLNLNFIKVDVFVAFTCVCHIQIIMLYSSLLKNTRLVLATFLSATAMLSTTRSANLTEIIFSPVSGVINSGDPGFGSLADTYNQNGLSTKFVSGVTDFDAYLALNPIHSNIFAGNEWFSNSGTQNATVTYDLGSVLNIDRLALWNEESSGIGRLNLLSSTDNVNFSALALGLTPLDNPAEEYPAQVFSFATASARYVRFEASLCPQPNPSTFPACAIGEVAFSVNNSATSVPKPFTIVGTLIGATVAFRTRQRLKATNKL